MSRYGFYAPGYGGMGDNIQGSYIKDGPWKVSDCTSGLSHLWHFEEGWLYEERQGKSSPVRHATNCEICGKPGYELIYF